MALFSNSYSVRLITMMLQKYTNEVGFWGKLFKKSTISTNYKPTSCNGQSLLSPTSTGILIRGLLSSYHRTLSRLGRWPTFILRPPYYCPSCFLWLVSYYPISYSDPWNSFFTVLDITSPFVALSTDHDYLVPHTPADVDSCHRTPLPRCIRQFPIWTTLGSTICELAASLKDDAGIVANSQMSFFLKRLLPNFFSFYDTFWAYFFFSSPRYVSIV